MGLLDPEKLDNDAEWSDKNSEWSASGRGAVGMQSGCGRIEESEAQQGLQADMPEIAQKARIREKNKSALAAVVA